MVPNPTPPSIDPLLSTLEPEPESTLPFHWAELPTCCVGDQPYREATANARWSMAIEGGRQIVLTWLEQNETHGGLLAGSPRQPDFNDFLVKNAIRDVVRRRDIPPSSVAVLAPRMLKVRVRKRPADPGPEALDLLYLPPIRSVGVFESAPIDEAKGEFSMAVVLWYQDAYGPPTEGHVMEQLGRIVWEKVAVDCGW